MRGLVASRFRGRYAARMALLARLGFVVYMLAWAVGVPMLAVFLWGFTSGQVSPSGQAVFAVLGGGTLLTGRAVYYVLAGR